MSIMVLILSAPLFLGAIILLAFANNGSVFFTQLRPGYKGRIFRIIKFKTMTDKKGEDGNLLPDNERMTLVGQWVRKLSLDEIPQMINVLKGDMSMIGPRPLLPEYLPLYSSEQSRRHDARPGITGWAQVNGRNAISWQEKFKLDVYYVENTSFLLDVKILLRTFLKVAQVDGITDGASSTAEKFKGN